MRKKFLFGSVIVLTKIIIFAFLFKFSSPATTQSFFGIIAAIWLIYVLICFFHIKRAYKFLDSKENPVLEIGEERIEKYFGSMKKNSLDKLVIIRKIIWWKRLGISLLASIFSIALGLLSFI